jgi:hypothetical protein
MKEDERHRAKTLFIVLAVLCVFTGLLLGAVSYPRQEIGSADMAGYAEIGRSLIEGRPFHVGFVQHFFLKHQSPMHPADHYAPMKGILMAPFFLFLGVTPFVTTLPSLIIGTLLFPLLVFGICRRLGLTPAACFVAGLATLWNPLFINHATESLADIDQAFFGACALYVLLGRPGWKRPVFSGCWTALAFLTKTSGLFLIPGYLLFFAADDTRKPAGRLKHAVLYLLFFFLVSSPWLLRNQKLYGDPLYTANKYIAAMTDYCGMFEMVGPAVALYWDSEPPTLTDVPARYGVKRMAEVLAGRLLATLKYLPFLGSILLAPLLLRDKKIRIISMGALFFALVSFITFAVHERYLLTLFPAGIALTAALLNLLGRALGSYLSGAAGMQPGTERWRFHRPEKTAAALIFMSLFLFVGGFVESAETIVAKYGLFRSPPASYASRLSEWIDRHTPADAVIMSMSAIEIRFYTGRLTISPTSSEPAAFSRILRHYGADYFAMPAASPKPVFNPIFNACQAYVNSPYFSGQLLTGNRAFRIWRLDQETAGHARMRHPR